MACQACHQPLLRCSVCSLYMTLDPPKSAFDEKKGSNYSNCMIFKIFKVIPKLLNTENFTRKDVFKA